MKGELTIEAVIKKYKEDYERNISHIKEEHEKVYGKKLVDNTEAENKERYIEQTKAEYKTIALLEAEKVWLNVKVAATDAKFAELKDEEKINLLRKDFKEFYDNFPIVSRYMICMLQYRQKAFKKFLKKCEIKLVDIKGAEGERQRIWIECQADYVRYLWEECQTRRFTRAESNLVWRQTYDALSNEFKQFKELHATTEEKIKQTDKKNKVQLLKEMTGRIIEQSQSLDTEDTIRLVELKNKLYKQNYSKVLQELRYSKDSIRPVFSAYGTSEAAGNDYNDELKQAEVKKKYKLDIPI